MLETLPPGRRYLVEQRLRQECREGVALRMETLCRQLAEQLTLQGKGFRERSLPPVADSGRRPLGHWAILWPAQQATALEALLENAAVAWQPEGIQLQWSGPWPPYSFRPVLETSAGVKS
jgi:hypothetical protein